MQFEVQFTVAISNMVSSRLGHFEGEFTVAIIDLVGSRLGQFEVQFTVAITIIRQFILFNIEKNDVYVDFKCFYIMVENIFFFFYPFYIFFSLFCFVLFCLIFVSHQHSIV